MSVSHGAIIAWYDMLRQIISKRGALGVMLFVAFIPTVFAQGSADEYCATSVLLNYDAAMNETVTTQDLEVGIKSPPGLGETRNFWTIGRQVVATCRAIGNHCYVFVEDSVWGKPGIITQNELEDLLVAFDSTTTKESIDSTKGIFEISTEAFGPVPDEIDHDPKIYILYLATTAQGYFDPINQTLSPTSNKVEMFYIAADINSRFPSQGPDYHKRIVAHELLHLIHWGRSRLNAYWINEGCAEFASYICGYYGTGISNTISYHYLSNYSNLSLTDFQSLMSYPLTFTFMLYLAEKFGGIPSISKLITTQTQGIDAITEVLSSLSYSQRFEDVFTSWQLAIYLDHLDTVDSMYEFESIDIPPFDHVSNHDSYPVSSTIDTVQSWAGQFIGFIGEPEVRIIVHGNPGLSFVLLSARAPDKINFHPIALNNEYKGEYRFSQKDIFTLVISNKSSLSKLYTYSANYLTAVALASERQVPRLYQLFQNTPNPFSRITTIGFHVPQPGRIRLTIYNVSGQKIKSLLDENSSVGLHTVRWNGRNDEGVAVASGVYFYILETDRYTYSKKMILIL